MENTEQREDRIVNSIGYALVAVGSIDSGVSTWVSLGFPVGDTHMWFGQACARIEFGSGGIVLVERPGDEGLFGWIWSCADPARSAQRVLAAAAWADGEATSTSQEGPGASRRLPASATPGAVTFLEKTYRADSTKAENLTIGIDHLVVASGNVEATAHAYEIAFGLRARGREMKGRRYSFLKVGDVVIEIVGPNQPDSAAPPPRLWGLALRSSDIDATAARLAASGFAAAGPKPAIQGGRILSLHEPVSGVPLAWLAEDAS